MNKLALIALMAASLSAQAEWTEITRNTESSFFMDFKTARPTKKDSYRIWTLINFNKQITDPVGVSFSSATSVMEVDCKKEMWRTLQEDLYSEPMAIGNVIRSWTVDQGGGSWKFATPNTRFEALVQIVCGGAEEARKMKKLAR